LLIYPDAVVVNLINSTRFQKQLIMFCEANVKNHEAVRAQARSETFVAGLVYDFTFS
jgi:hypothetical protein